jgi:hypothetical protein
MLCLSLSGCLNRCFVGCLTVTCIAPVAFAAAGFVYTKIFSKSTAEEELRYFCNDESALSYRKLDLNKSPVKGNVYERSKFLKRKGGSMYCEDDIRFEIHFCWMAFICCIFSLSSFLGLLTPCYK